MECRAPACRAWRRSARCCSDWQPADFWRWNSAAGTTTSRGDLHGHRHHLRGAAGVCRHARLGALQRGEGRELCRSRVGSRCLQCRVGFADPAKSAIEDGIVGYLETVIRVEWPAQARGLTVDRGSAYLQKLNGMATGFKPAGVADGNLQAQLLQSLTRLSDARQSRLLAADTAIPVVVWIVTIVGGVLTVGFAALLGVPSLGMHLVMSAALAVSGRAGADPDHRAQQPVPRRLPRLDPALRPSLGAHPVIG